MLGLVEYKITDKEFKKLRDFVYEHTGIVLNDFKKDLVLSRLSKRLRKLNLGSFAEYYSLLAQRDPEGQERVNLINSITTNKTSFFREPNHFEFMRSTLLPELERAARSTGVRRLRIWSSACSTGEEPYTLAMVLAEHFGTSPSWQIEILASDIDTAALNQAVKGVFEEDRVKEIPPLLLRRYFLRAETPGGVLYKVKPELRNWIRFKKVNLSKAPLPVRGPFDAVFCRNVIIYFDRPTQRRLFAEFHRLIKPDGYVFIGHSESLLGISGKFVYVQGTIYRKR